MEGYEGPSPDARDLGFLETARGMIAEVRRQLFPQGASEPHECIAVGTLAPAS